MAATKISALPASSALAGSEEFASALSSANYKVTSTQIKTWCSLNPTVSGVLTVAGGTVTASAPAVAVTQTWNSGAVTFVGVDNAFTDTASASASKVEQWRVGATTVAALRKDGQLTVAWLIGNGGSGSNYFSISNGTFSTVATGTVSWSADTNATGTKDAHLVRIGAGIVGVGSGAAGASAGTLQTGGMIVGLTAKTANYTALFTDRIITGDAAGGAITITLPTAVGRTGQMFTVKKIDSSGNAVNVASTSSQTFDGAATPYTSLTTQWSKVTFVSDGANWLSI